MRHCRDSHIGTWSVLELSPDLGRHLQAVGGGKDLDPETLANHRHWDGTTRR